MQPQTVLCLAESTHVLWNKYGIISAFLDLAAPARNNNNCAVVLKMMISI